MSFSSGTFSINTAGQPVVSGTTISSVAFNALTADLATGLTTCLLKDGTQTATAVIPFASGISVSGGSTLATYTTGTTSSTFTWDGGGGTSSAVTLTWQRIGNWVTLNIPAVTATTGTGSANFTSDTAIASGARPSSTQVGTISSIRNNNGTIGPTGWFSIASTGIININRDAIATAFTNSANAGITSNNSITYFVG